MTAPSTAQPLFTIADPHLCYLSPASTDASDYSFSWTEMPPLQESNAPRQSKQAKSPPRISSPNDNGNNFLFITGSNPNELKSKKNMTIIRKKAMGHFLENEKKEGNPRGSMDRPRLNSEASDLSRSSFGSQDAPGPSFAVPQTINRRKSSQKKQMSPIEASVSTRNDRQAPSPEAQIVRIRQPIEMVLEAPSIFLPIRPVRERVFDTTNVPSLTSIGKALDPFKTMFQSSNPRVSVEELKHTCSKYFGTRGLGKYWIPTCVERPHSFLSTLYLAAVYHDVIHEHKIESLETVALRQDIIKMVMGDFLDCRRSVDDHNIIAVSQLIIGEVIAREETSLAFHEAGMEKMIQQRGGLTTLGLQGRIASAVSWVNLASAILRGAKPRPMYLSYIKTRSTKEYAPGLKIPESPIFCPRSKFFTLEVSKKCNKRTLQLLCDIRMMIDMFLHETTNGSRRNSGTIINLYRDITTKYPPVAQLSQTTRLDHADWKYEAIRITAIVQATAILQRVPLPEALDQATSHRKASTTLSTNSLASRSNESLFSTLDPQQGSPMTEYSISPTAYPIHDPVTGRPGFPFDTPIVSFDAHRYSQSSTQSSAPHRPSLSSIPSTSSDMLWFPSRAVPPPPSTPTSLLQNLKDALENSNLSDCWLDMAGVLLWIGLVMGAASRNNENKSLKKYYSATTMRAGIMLCFEHPEAVHGAVLRMTEVVEMLGDAEHGQIVKMESETAGKRRRQA